MVTFNTTHMDYLKIQIPTIKSYLAIYRNVLLTSYNIFIR